MKLSDIQKYNLQPVDISIARKIRIRRHELGLSQKELANMLGVTRPNVAQLEVGRNKLKHNTLLKIAEILDKPVSYFLGEDVLKKDIDETLMKKNSIRKITDNIKIKKYLYSKGISKNFINDLENYLNYLCEIHQVKKDDIW